MIMPSCRGRDTTRRLICAVALLALLAGPRPTAWAAPPEPGDIPEVRRAIAKANALAGVGQYDDALTIYERVLSEAVDTGLADRAGLLGNIGHCLDKLDRPRDAVLAFDAARDAAQDEATRALLGRVIERMERERLGRLTVECDAVSALIRLAGRETKPCPATLEHLEPGEPLLIGTTPGGIQVEARAPIRPGYTTHLALQFPARLVIGGEPGAHVIVNGDMRCMTPCDVDISAGVAHAVEVDAGWRRWQHTVTAEPAALIHIEPLDADELEWLWVGVGVGVGALVGAVLGLALADTLMPTAQQPVALRIE